MGTNYYLRVSCGDLCEKCKAGSKADIVMHIGKYSYGYGFLFQAYPDREIEDFARWKPLLEKYQIYDEYGEYCRYDEFLEIINSGPKRAVPIEPGEYFDEMGYLFRAGDFL